LYSDNERRERKGGSNGELTTPAAEGNRGASLLDIYTFRIDPLSLSIPRDPRENP